MTNAGTAAASTNGSRVVSPASRYPIAIESVNPTARISGEPMSWRYQGWFRRAIRAARWAIVVGRGFMP